MKLKNKIFTAGICTILFILSFYAFYKVNLCNKKKKLFILGWANSVDQESIKSFEKKYNADVYIKTYTTNEELLSKLTLSNEHFDIIFPSDFAIEELLSLSLIKSINIDKISDFNFISSEYLSSVQFNKKYYAIPNEWNIFGIVTTKKMYYIMNGDEGTIYKAFFEGNYKNKKIRIAQLADMTVLTNIVYHYYKSLFLKNRIYIKNNLLTIILEILKKQKESVITYTEDLVLDLFKNDLIDMALMESDNFLYINKEAPDLGLHYIFPPNHILRIVDFFAIPQSVQNEELAYEFINFMLEEKQILTKREHNLSFPPKDYILKKKGNKIEKEIIATVEKNKKNTFPISYILDKKELISLSMQLKS